MVPPWASAANLQKASPNPVSVLPPRVRFAAWVNFQDASLVFWRDALTLVYYAQGQVRDRLQADPDAWRGVVRQLLTDHHES